VAERTTLTLEDDVAAQLREEARRSGRSFKVVVNEAIRLGLKHARAAPAKPFRVAARDLGVRPEIDLDDVEGLLDRLEGVDRR
jgi:hypothetical protein